MTILANLSRALQGHHPHPSTHTTRTLLRSHSFRPRRTPPPTLAGINLTPRGDPASSLKKPTPSTNNTTTAGGGGGRGASPQWISPHHVDYYGKIDESTLDHPHLLHGDPHMPVQRFTGGEGKVVLLRDGRGRERARELDDYRIVGKRGLVEGLLEEEDFDEEEDEEEEDDLSREFGSAAAEAIRNHLYTQRKKLEGNKRSGVDNSRVHSPLQELESKLRTIDRLTAAQGSTEDLAFARRSRTESREFFKLGSIPPLDTSKGGDRDIDDNDGLDGTLSGSGNNHEQEEYSEKFTVLFPYGKPRPSPTYHKDYPLGSGVGDNPTDEEEEEWMHELNRLIYEEEYTEFALGPVNVQADEIQGYMKEKDRVKQFNLLDREDRSKMDREEKEDEILEMIKRGDDPNQEAFGPWGECTIKVDRVQKVERGGTTVRYRALVIGGNGNGAAGFGIGKALSPNEAIIKACKHCKRNVFYVNRYLNTGLSYDLAGKHNSCRVQLRAVRPDFGLHGHPLICEILMYAGITDCSSKSHGNRNPYNVVYATFKALMTHESLEDIAMKRGKKLLNLQRARRLGL
ncbi:hypothetical protein HJC23_001212 [Cyclotella cryptica]|uniref:S5 DRBM domain-containing protein n=1 Tax=Cyclotella cryptica TaxID=29204 RepID=A0ABD3QQE1_9STRA